MMIADHHFLIHPDHPVVYLAYADTSHVFVIVDGADQNLSACLRVALRSRNIVYDGFE